MKRFRKPCIFFLLFILLLPCAMGCKANQRVFTYQDGGMTDGTVKYIAFPKSWYYYGDFPFKIGKVKNGNAVLASDENETVIKQRDDLFADMGYALFVREDVSFPDVYDRNNQVLLYDYGRSLDPLVLSETAKDELLTILESIEQSNPETITKVRYIKPSYIRLQNPQLKNMTYFFEPSILLIEKKVYIGDYPGTNGGFDAQYLVDSESDLYREVFAFRQQTPNEKEPTTFFEDLFTILKNGYIQSCRQ